MFNKIVKKCDITKLIVTSIVILHVTLSTTAHAIKVQYDLIPLGGEQYRYVYTVTNDGSLGDGVSVSLFDLVFDSASYQESSLAIVTPAPLNSEWDEFLLSSIFDEPAAYSAFSSTIGIAPGETVSGFAVEFEWIGGAALPGKQTFQVFDPNTFELLEEGTTSFIDDPTVVTLVDFTATALKNEIVLEWGIAYELDNAGFHIWRATGEGWRYGDYSTVVRLTEQLLSPISNSSWYSYVDDDVESELTYYYGLEDLDVYGHSTFHWDYIDWATAK